MNYGRRYETLYRRQGSRPSPWKRYAKPNIYAQLILNWQSKPFNITVIQVYAPTNNAEEGEVEWFYEDLRDLLELTPKKDVLFIIGDWNANIRS